MKQHKWHKEIKAWADGAEIEEYAGNNVWLGTSKPLWNENIEYRIKPQPKEPQYLYVYGNYGLVAEFREKKIEEPNGIEYIGKIKLEQDDED